MQNIRDTDEKHLYCIAELGHYTYVRCVGEDLYIAEVAHNDKYWHRVARKSPPIEYAPLAAPNSYEGTTCSNPAATFPGCPALHIANASELYSLPSYDASGTGALLFESPEAYHAIEEGILPFLNCAKQNVETDFGALNPVAAPKTTGSTYENNRGCAKQSEFRNRKLVNPDTGKAAAVGTKDAVTASCYYSRKPVNSVSGKAVPAGTPGAVSSSVFRNSRLVHPETGILASQDTVGAITRALFYKRRSKRRKEEARRSQMAARQNDKA